MAITAEEAYALSRKFTKDTASQFGALKGASCTIASIVHQNKQTIVTFQWENDAGEIKESKMYVEDGTPIYEYVVGDTYHYGDLVIYASAFYRCTVAEYVAEDPIDDTKFSEIGSPDGNYDIVQNASLLPVRFTAADRKMYYAIEDAAFYLWNGTNWVKQETTQQFSVMPTPASIYLDRIVQYVGATNTDFVQGYFYRCDYDGTTYEWVSVDTQKINELTTEQVNNLLSIL